MRKMQPTILRNQTVLNNLSSKVCSVKLLNENPTSDRLRFDASITSIGRRENINKFPCHFDVLFRCYFDWQKIHFVSTYLVQANFEGRKIDSGST